MMGVYYKFWIKKTFYECPVCGSGSEYRERKPLPKPEDPKERYEWVAYYDGCNAL